MWSDVTTVTWLTILAHLITLSTGRNNVRTYEKEDLIRLKEQVSAMFHRAYDGYWKHAYPYDELKPLTCEGFDTWGSYSLTLIDALDTLAIMGNHTEFQRVYHLISERENFDNDINVSVFETNIRIVGGLVSGHLLAKRAGVKVGPGWPCEGPLLRLAEDAATRLLPAFDTPTGMPYGTVNLRHGVPKDETPVTCTAGVGTFIVEFGALSRLTGNPVFEETALRALRALWYHRSKIGLVGNHLDVVSGKWTATDAGIGAGVDSYYEYLIKGSILLQRPELMKMFKMSQESIEQYLHHDDWYFWVAMNKGTVTMTVFQSLEAFWPGALSLIGENMKGMKSMHNYHQIWKQYGFLPEFYNVAQRKASSKREGYPLRPEFIESAMYLYRTTKDPFLLNIGEDAVYSIEHSARTDCGYATVKNAKDHTLEDRMESFFLSETTKYLYLLFDEDNFIHNPGNSAEIIDTKYGQCVIDAGGYIFNTEAHPVDPAALQCCSGHSMKEVKDQIVSHLKNIADAQKYQEFKGDLIPARIKAIQAAKEEEDKRRKERKEEHLKQLEELWIQERQAIKRKQELELERKKLILSNMSEDDGYFKRNMSENKNKETDDVTKLGTIKEEKVEEHSDRMEESFSVQNDDEKNDVDGSGKDDFVRQNEEHQMEAEVDYDDEDDDDDEETDSSGGLSKPVPPETPEFSSASKAEESGLKEAVGNVESDLMIKKQSKDEATESVFNSDKEVKPPIKEKKNVVEALTDMFLNILPAKLGRRQFSLEQFSEKVMTREQFKLNPAWYDDHSVMFCPARTFLERFSLQGEFFDEY